MSENRVLSIGFIIGVIIFILISIYLVAPRDAAATILAGLLGATITLTLYSFKR